MNFRERLEFLREAPSLPDMGNLPYVHDVEYGSILHAVLYRLVEHMRAYDIPIVHMQLRRIDNYPLDQTHCCSVERFHCVGYQHKALPSFFVPLQNLQPDDYLMYSYLIRLSQGIFHRNRTDYLSLETTDWDISSVNLAARWHKPEELDKLCLADLFYEYCYLRFWYSYMHFSNLKLAINRLSCIEDRKLPGDSVKPYSFGWLMELGRRFNF